MANNLTLGRMVGSGVSKLGEDSDACQLIRVTFYAAFPIISKWALGCHALIQTLAFSLGYKAQTLRGQRSGSLSTSPLMPYNGGLLIGCRFPIRAFSGRWIVVILIATQVDELQPRLLWYWTLDLCCKRSCYLRICLLAIHSLELSQYLLH